MSRTNPYKKKRRQASRTLLIFGEGLGEEMFLKHLKGLYSRNSDVAITVRKGRGGTADGIVIDAAKVPGAFNRKVVVLDNDKSRSEMKKARAEADKRKIELIESTPCLEYVLLSIVEDKDFKGKNSNQCKKEFEQKYLNKKKRSELEEYTKIFPRELLDKRRLKVSELSKMIAILEGR